MRGAEQRFLVLAEKGGHHVEYTKRAAVWLDELAKEEGFVVDTIHTPDPIDDAFLEGYELFIQLDYPPYGWNPEAAVAFERYIEEGRGGWIGFHHASLFGEFDGHPMWDWFHHFLGGIRFKDYIPTFASAEVKVETSDHPVMKGVPATFRIGKEEWYTYDRSPRPDVHVLASVDECTYRPDSEVKMGDHPVVWTNTKMKARNLYIFMGHGPDLFDNAAYTTLFRNAILWATGDRSPYGL